MASITSRNGKHKANGRDKLTSALADYAAQSNLAAANPPKTRTWKTHADVTKKQPAAAPLFTGAFVQGPPVYIAGPPRQGKSKYGFAMLAAATAGKPWLGFEWGPGEPWRAALCGYETPENQTELFLKKAWRSMGLSEKERAAASKRLKRHYDISEAVDLNNPADVEAFAEDLRKQKRKIVLLDSLLPLLSDVQNKADAGKLMKLLYGFQNTMIEAGVQPVIVTHFHSMRELRNRGKNYGTPPDIQDMNYTGVAYATKQYLLAKDCEEFDKTNRIAKQYFIIDGVCDCYVDRYAVVKETKTDWSVTFLGKEEVKELSKSQKQQESMQKAMEAEHQRKVAVYGYLKANGPCSKTHIADNCTGVSRSTIDRVLQAVVKAGRAKQQEDGQYVAVPKKSPKTKKPTSRQTTRRRQRG